MGQNPIGLVYAKNEVTSTLQTLLSDNAGRLLVSDNAGDELSVLNIGTAESVVSGACVLGRISVLNTGTVAGTINDITSTGTPAAANAIMSIPTTVGVYAVEWPMKNGLYADVATGQTIAVTYRLP